MVVLLVWCFSWEVCLANKRFLELGSSQWLRLRRGLRWVKIQRRELSKCRRNLVVWSNPAVISRDTIPPGLKLDLVLFLKCWMRPDKLFEGCAACRDLSSSPMLRFSWRAFFIWHLARWGSGGLGWDLGKNKCASLLFSLTKQNNCFFQPDMGGNTFTFLARTSNHY